MMTDNERAVIEAAVEWGRVSTDPHAYPEERDAVVRKLRRALNEMHGEHDGKWRPSDD